MDEEIWAELLARAKVWALDQKRITNKMIRDRFDVAEEDADDVYKYLKAAGIVGTMGYVGLEDWK